MKVVNAKFHRSVILLCLISLILNGCTIMMSQMGGIADNEVKEKTTLEQPFNLWKLERYDYLFITLKTGETVEGELVNVMWGNSIIINSKQNNTMRINQDDIDTIAYYRAGERHRKYGLYVGIFIDVYILYLFWGWGGLGGLPT